MAHHDTIKEGRHLVASAEALLETRPKWREGSLDQRRLSGAVQDLKEALSLVDGNLVLGILGGTGVGKSTLISALAGAEISAASPIRPTSTKAVIYRHQDFVLPQNIEGQEVIHHLETLKGIAVVDFPDFDSLETKHHQIVNDSLKNLDLVVWLTDYNKYADRRFYELFAEVQKLVAASSQMVLLNKVDELRKNSHDPQAEPYILGALERELQNLNWTEASLFPVSAAEGLGYPEDKSAGGLAPLRERLAELAAEKMRQLVAMGNLNTRYIALKESFQNAAQPKVWEEEVEALKKFNFKPNTSLEGDLALLSLQQEAYVFPHFDALQKNTGGLLSFFTDITTFINVVLQRKTPHSTIEPQAQIIGLTNYLAGCREDLKEIIKPLPPWKQDAFARQGAEIINENLMGRLNKTFVTNSFFLWLWPFLAGILLVWAESNGVYEGPVATVSAALRSAMPWLIASVGGDLILTYFIWHRARRRLGAAFQKGLLSAKEEILTLTDKDLGDFIKDAQNQRNSQLEAWRAFDQGE